MSNGTNWSLSCLPRVNPQKEVKCARPIESASKGFFGFSVAAHAGRIPDRFPSGSTCWRRMNEWHEQDVWIDIWHTFLGMLDAQGRLDWEEVFADRTFSPAKKGALASEKPNAAREQKLWWQQMVRAYQSGCALLPRRLMNRN